MSTAKNFRKIIESEIYLAFPRLDYKFRFIVMLHLSRLYIGMNWKIN